MRESAIPWIDAFLAKRAAFAHQTECLVIALQEEHSLKAYGPLPAANQTCPLAAVIAIKIRKIMSALKQKRDGIFGNDFANFFRCWRRRGTAPAAIIKSASVATFQLDPFRYGDLIGGERMYALYPVNFRRFGEA